MNSTAPAHSSVHRGLPARPLLAAVALAAVMGLLGGCGQKGPLYLPNAQNAQKSAVPPSGTSAPTGANKRGSQGSGDADSANPPNAQPSASQPSLTQPTAPAPTPQATTQGPSS